MRNRRELVTTSRNSVAVKCYTKTKKNWLEFFDLLTGRGVDDFVERTQGV